MSRPKKFIELSSPYWTMPSFSLMPHSQTIARAHAGGLLDVAGGAAADVAEENFLRHAAAHDDDELVEHFLFPVRDACPFPAGTWSRPARGRAG